jgi:hypothetical protein
MDLAIRLLVMLGAGILAKHAVSRLGQRLAAGSAVRIPKLCSLATAGCLAAAIRMGLGFTSLHDLVVAGLFGLVWGAVAGMLLPFARRVPSV